MSRGSTFVFLRKPANPVKVTEKEIVQKAKEYCYYIDDIDFNKVPKYYYFDKYHYVDTEEFTLLDNILEVSFTSTFECLKEEFNLNPYSSTGDRVVITKNTADRMLQAIRYLYCDDYSTKMEEMLDNHYIYLFEDMHPSYRRYKYPEWEDTDREGFAHLKRLKSVLEAYTLMCNEADDDSYVLLYYAWG